MIIDFGGGNTITLKTPLWGYTVDYGMNLHVTRTGSGKYRLFDCGASHDTIACNCTLTDTADAMHDFLALVRSYGRGAVVTLKLGATPTGFYPAGPAGGDVGDFTAYLTSLDPTGWLQAPWGYTECGVCFKIQSAPAYALPAEVSQGSFEIGTVDGLRWPEPGFTPAHDYGFAVEISRDGTGYGIDTGAARDRWTAEWTQPLNQSKAAALQSFLAGAGRGADTTIVAQKNGYLFGVDNAEADGSGTYTANLINGDESGTILTYKHIRFNEWSVPLKYWMQTFTPEPS